MLVASVIASHLLLVAQTGLGWERNAPSGRYRQAQCWPPSRGRGCAIYIARRPEMYACFVEFVFVSSPGGLAASGATSLGSIAGKW